MKEKIKKVFQSERLKNLSKKFLNKKTLKIYVAIIVVAVVLRIGFSILFEINGVVRKVDGNNITVANFFTTQTINTGDYLVDSSIIKVGDRIEISKNIQGQVLSIKDFNHDNRNFNNNLHQENQFNNKGGKVRINGKH